MLQRILGEVSKDIRHAELEAESPTDAESVARHVAGGDDPAFGALVRRHGPMVLAVCRRMLPLAKDADPAPARGGIEAVLDEELHRLPGHYSDPLILCYLEGKSREEAARQLGGTLGTLRGRLEAGSALQVAQDDDGPVLVRPPAQPFIDPIRFDPRFSPRTRRTTILPLPVAKD